nr:ribonuclease H-like domain-containing protein [Tanacetum cinerariifolium]
EITCSCFHGFIDKDSINLVILDVKREFSNARTPQQNGVAERRNRTLIEASRPIFADAKLPVTFWAEAVNTACYVQNRVLVNKSQNKTLYELFNGRTPAKGFLKPFSCHVMILNTLDNLGKFEAKGDEGYLIGYSMSSKAFRVFNKRTRRVEENLHVEFLENQAIKKGTNSTNLSGTKDAASQEVKKDVSSLRYIALPNWVHDALLESSSSKPQDDYSTDVPESSGNSHPTAISTNPSIRDTNSGNSHSYIDSDGEEADVSNMETTITSSPTPTLRIHKDHPKSQIIDPVDTLIQTRNKSKEDLKFLAKVYKVEKAMYGLHQAPRAWQRGDFILVQVYVDDIIFGSSNPQLCREFEALIHEKFQMSAMVKRIFRYLKGHPKLGLWYPKESPFDLVAYSNSGYGGATQDRKSTTRWCQFFGRRLISWQCKKQIIMATSTTEAEYVVAASCCRQVLWIQNQLLDYGDYFEKKLISVDHVHTDENAADILTKPFDAGRFQYLVVSIGMCKHFPLLGKLSTVSVFLGFGLTFAGTSKYWCLLRILMISLRLIPLGEGSGTPTEPHHTPSSEAQPISSTTPSSPTLPSVTTAPILSVTSSNTPPLRQYTKRARIAQSSTLRPVADEHASPLRDVSLGEACPTDSGFGADQDRANIAKTSTLLYDSAPRVTSPTADEGSMQQTLDELTALCISLQRQHSKMVSKFEAQELEINMLKARVKLLEDKEGGAERVSDDTKEMATVLTSMDAATVLASGIAEVPTSSGSIPTAGPPAAEVPTSSDVVPTAGLIFATATVVTPYKRRKGKETMVESETPKKTKVQEQIDAQVVRELEEQMAREDQRMSEQLARDAEIARIHAKEELQIMIDGLDKSNETVAKYLQEYHQFASELPLERRIELIRDLVRYQDNYAKIKNFIPIGSKEEAERFKRKGIRFEQESAKKLKTSEEVPEEVKSPDEVLKEKVKEMMQLVPVEEVYVEAFQVKHPIINRKVYTEGQRSYWKVTRLGGSSASYQFFVDMLKHLDREDLNQL